MVVILSPSLIISPGRRHRSPPPRPPQRGPPWAGARAQSPPFSPWRLSPCQAPKHHPQFLHYHLSGPAFGLTIYRRLSQPVTRKTAKGSLDTTLPSWRIRGSERCHCHRPPHSGPLPLSFSLSLFLSLSLSLSPSPSLSPSLSLSLSLSLSPPPGP